LVRAFPHLVRISCAGDPDIVLVLHAKTLGANLPPNVHA
jgi:hypothetical protein